MVKRMNQAKSVVEKMVVSKRELEPGPKGLASKYSIPLKQPMWLTTSLSLVALVQSPAMLQQLHQRPGLSGGVHFVRMSLPRKMRSLLLDLLGWRECCAVMPW